MTEHTITITIEGTETGSKLFNDVSRAAEGAGKRVDASFNKKMADLGKTATDTGKKLTVGVTTPLTVLGGVSINAALKSERLRTSLEGLAGGADEASQYIRAIQEASLGTISQLDAMAFSTKALTLGVVDNSEAMADLTEVAITLGRAQGLTAAQAVDDLTTALGRQSPLILDNLGITLKMSEAYKIHASQLGKSADALTDAEKQQAFLNAALVKGKEVAASLGGVTLDSAAKVEQMKAKASDLAAELGAELIPAFEAGVDVVSTILGWFSNLDDTSKKLIVTLGLLAAGSGPVLTAFGSMATLVSKMPTSVAGLNAALHSTQGMLIVVAAAVVATTAAFSKYNQELERVIEAKDEAVAVADKWSDSAGEMIANGADVSDVMADLALRTNETTDAWNGNIFTGTALGAVFNSHGKIMEVYAKTQSEVNQIAREGTSSYAEYTQVIDGYNANVKDGSAHVRALTEEMYDLVQSGELGTDLFSDLNSAFFTARDAMSGVEQDTSAAGGAYDSMIGRSQALQAAFQGSVTWTNNNAAALDNMRARAAEAAAAQTGLAMTTKDATDQQLAQQFIGMLDPEAMGADAYTEAVTQIQLSTGLADEKSIALSQTMGTLAEALNANIVPAQDADAAFKTLIDDAADGEVNMAGLREEFFQVPDYAGPAAGKLDEFNESLGSAQVPAQGLTADLGGLEDRLNAVAKTWTVTVQYETVGTPSWPGGAGGGIPEFQGGGVVPGPLGQPRLVIAHGGEHFLGAPSMSHSTTNQFNDTMNVTVNDALAAAILTGQRRQKRLSRMASRV